MVEVDFDHLDHVANNSDNTTTTLRDQPRRADYVALAEPGRKDPHQPPASHWVQRNLPAQQDTGAAIRTPAKQLVAQSWDHPCYFPAGVKYRKSGACCPFFVGIKKPSPLT
jgi:hypothetical protein